METIKKMEGSEDMKYMIHVTCYITEKRLDVIVICVVHYDVYLFYFIV
jgi:hypothetical protein